MYSSSGKFLLICLIAFSTKVFSYKNDFVSKVGIALSQVSFNTLEGGKEVEDEHSKSWGIHTSFSYMGDGHEYGVDSRITLGKETDLIFRIDDDRIDGRGSIRSVDISPFYKIHTKTQRVSPKVQNFFSGIYINPWYGYLKIGTIWVIQSIDLDNFNINSDFRKDHKLTNESFGGTLALGLEEDTPYKSMHPIFLEVALSVYRSYQVSLVDKSDATKINILSAREIRQDIVGYSVHFILGMALF